ncbi:hypothetical protein Ocin01_12343 [Orchesella cincta]|uniref:Myofilin n=1 Tax=Orchesella cincta TaxID=48709 RepID=A0A1D2MN98_ORCCI|nr:hypothetical protein Ocin01_12343 [Orchesella cincta]
MSFKNHFDMLSLHEPVTHKARFWQSYVRALKGTEDIRADEHQARLRLRPRALSEFPEFFGKSLLDDRLVSDPNTRIHAPGYRYMPISRETYGYSPRPIYPRPILTTRGSSVPPELEIPSWRESSPVPVYPRSHYSPKPWDRESTPAPSTPSYYYGGGVPMHGSRGGYNYRPYSDLYNPSPNLPISMITRDPWWYDAYGLRPYSIYPRYPRYPSALRTSYLSPVKNRYLWTRHPLRYL